MSSGDHETGRIANPAILKCSNLMYEQHVSNVQMWPLMNILDQEIRNKVHLVFCFGVNATEVIFTTMDKKVYALGCNRHGCSGCGNEVSSMIPQKISELDGKKVVSISAGSGPHVVVLTDDGEVYSWGDNKSSQVGNGDSITVLSPFLVSRFITTKVTRVACGSYHTLAVTENGEVYSWGFNNYGQIGCGSTASQGSPRKISFPVKENRMIDVSCCQNSSFALSCVGSLFSWGYNGNGQLGLNKDTHQRIPCLISLLSNITIKKISGGHSHVFALSDEGELYGWGSNCHGQLGVENKLSASSPLKVAGNIGHVVSVAASHFSHTSAAQNLQGQVYMWGMLRSQVVTNPVLTHFSNLNAVFASFSSPPINWQPMQMGGDAKPTVQQSLTAAFNNEKTSDLKILVEGKIIHVHKAVLKIRWRYNSYF